MSLLVLDFGSQYTHLIARRLRELQVHAQIHPPTLRAQQLALLQPKGIILSGGPGSVSSDADAFDRAILDMDLPILGICYGMQLLNLITGGSVRPLAKGEYGKSRLRLSARSALLHDMQDEIVWMSHGESVEKLSPCFLATACSEQGLIAAIEHAHKPHFGLQFHPEVTHTPKGTQILDRFVDLCRCERNWTMDNFLQSTKQQIRRKVGAGRVVSLVSGGVDSTAATLLCSEALGAHRVHPLYIDTGLMREGESAQVREMFRELGVEQLTCLDASAAFLQALEGIVDPEIKRRVIGELFIEVLEREMAKLDQEEGVFFCQGTLYTDLIESGKGCGAHAAVIKSHHNVNPPIVERKRAQGLIVEPNATLFKDEVRQVCAALKVPKELIWRHPFPGPGLAIRILGEVTAERLALLRGADQIFLDELRRASYYERVWQAFALLVPVTTVGVMGDRRTQGVVVALRAVDSSDGMTAEPSSLPLELLARVATRISNELPQINRVVYDVTSKPPATIEWL